MRASLLAVVVFASACSGGDNLTQNDIEDDLREALNIPQVSTFCLEQFPFISDAPLGTGGTSFSPEQQGYISEKRAKLTELSARGLIRFSEKRLERSDMFGNYANIYFTVEPTARLGKYLLSVAPPIPALNADTNCYAVHVGDMVLDKVTGVREVSEGKKIAEIEARYEPNDIAPYFDPPANKFKGTGALEFDKYEDGWRSKQLDALREAKAKIDAELAKGPVKWQAPRIIGQQAVLDETATEAPICAMNYWDKDTGAVVDVNESSRNRRQLEAIKTIEERKYPNRRYHVTCEGDPPPPPPPPLAH